MNKVNKKNARPGVYTDVIDEISKKGICPFCPDQIGNIHPHPLDKREHWTITENAYPYFPRKQHLLLVHNEHIENLGEISEEAWQELRSIMQELKSSHAMDGGTFMLRFGDSKFTGASVVHLHAHFFQSDPDHPEYDSEKGVMTRVG